MPSMSWRSSGISSAAPPMPPGPRPSTTDPTNGTSGDRDGTQPRSTRIKIRGGGTVPAMSQPREPGRYYQPQQYRQAPPQYQQEPRRYPPPAGYAPPPAEPA